MNIRKVAISVAQKSNYHGPGSHEPGKQITEELCLS